MNDVISHACAARCLVAAGLASTDFIATSHSAETTDDAIGISIARVRHYFFWGACGAAEKVGTLWFSRGGRRSATPTEWAFDISGPDTVEEANALCRWLAKTFGVRVYHGARLMK